MKSMEAVEALASAPVLPFQLIETLYNGGVGGSRTAGGDG